LNWLKKKHQRKNRPFYKNTAKKIKNVRRKFIKGKIRMARKPRRIFAAGFGGAGRWPLCARPLAEY
jgi:hypothetical protein